MPAFSRSLGGRVFLLTASIVALAVVAAVGVSGWIASRSAERSVGEAIERANRTLASFHEQRFEQLRLIARLFVGDPYLAAYVAEAVITGDDLSILDLLTERQSDLGFDFAIALDPEGRVLARTDLPGSAGQDLSHEPLVRGALENFEAHGVWRTPDGLYYSIAVPVAVGSTLSGFVITGYSIDASVALGMKQLAGADVVFLADSSGEPRVVVSTLGEEVSRALETALMSRRGSAGGAGARELALDISGRRWIAYIDDLRGPTEEVVASVAVLLSVHEQLAPFKRMRSAMAISGLVAVLVAATAIYLLTRKALRPVGRLAEAARSAIGGQYDAVVEVASEDEVGELSRSFRRLLAELREKRDMVDYLAKISRTMPGEEATWVGQAPTERVPGLEEEETLLIKAANDARADGSAEGISTGGETRTFGERFQLLSVVGEGGMGVVYKARDIALDDIVALKTLKRELRRRPEWQRLKEELKLARKITHPNVLRTFDFGIVDGVPFISMEYVRGVTLRYLLAKRGPLPYSAGLHLARQLCRGLEAVHAEGVVHRDVKPGNLIVEANGNAKLMDFGVARPSEDRERDARELGMLVGTPDYLAPEQVEGREPTPHSDLYACGLVMFEIFTAERPFEGSKPADRMLQRLHREPLAPSQRRPEIPGELERIILKCLERDPNRRYASAGALLGDLEALSV